MGKGVDIQGLEYAEDTGRVLQRATLSVGGHTHDGEILAHRAARGPRSRAHQDQAFDPVRPDVSLHAVIRSQSHSPHE